MTRLALACLAAWTLLIAGPLFAADPTDQSRVLRAGFVEFPPFKYSDDQGNASGPWVEMTEKVAAEAGYRVKWVHLPIARVYLYLSNGRVDVWPGVAGIPQLDGEVYESEVTPMRVVLYAFHRNTVESPESLEALVGKPLVLINGFSYMGALRHLALEDRHLSTAPDHFAGLRMLELERGHYLLDYDEPVRAVQHQFPDLDLTGTPIFKARGAFVFSAALPDARAIVEKFDGAYRRLVHRGEIDALQQVPVLTGD